MRSFYAGDSFFAPKNKSSPFLVLTGLLSPSFQPWFIATERPFPCTLGFHEATLLHHTTSTAWRFPPEKMQKSAFYILILVCSRTAKKEICKADKRIISQRLLLEKKFWGRKWAFRFLEPDEIYRFPISYAKIDLRPDSFCNTWQYVFIIASDVNGREQKSTNITIADFSLKVEPLLNGWLCHSHGR